MNFFDAQHQRPELSRALSLHEGIVVACYCAAWCDTCRQYQPGFLALAQSMPQHVFVWIDIEENESLLGDEDIEDFPTLLVQSQAGNLFFGPMPPHPEHLQRLLASAAAGALPVVEAGPGALRQLLASAAQ